LRARLELLGAEKELTRRSDELAPRRQELPWVRIDKEYRFETDEGSASLADLSEDARSSAESVPKRNLSGTEERGAQISQG
jgi:predicted dithiol-disulfide oxidoreductase (DUF899 family)